VTCRVLLVDDYEPWRRRISSELQKSSPRWQIVGEASDGLEAIEKARVLRPDLILLDIGMPTLNGIQAAARILADNPKARILFMSEHRSSEVVEAALATGASGYLIKSEASAELMRAMSAAVFGWPFLSPSLAAQNVAEWKDQQARKGARHLAGFYPDEVSMLDDYATFAEGVLKAGTALIVLAIDAHREALQQRLLAQGVDVERAMRERQYLPLDVAEFLSLFMRGDVPDDTRFRAEVTSVLRDAAKTPAGEPRHVAAWGECAPTLWRQGNAEAAVRVEQLWDEVAAQHGVDTLCGYSGRSFTPDDEPIFQQIGAVHSMIHS
jgi:DNA-binding NarL/FixJ family response regulator